MTKQDELKLESRGCLAKAKDDEMLFILRGQDNTAPMAVLEWMKLNFNNCSESKLREAFECCIKMKNNSYHKSAD